jgi:hypothetical protein
LTNGVRFPFNVKQRDQRLGCIPASISAALQALGFPGVTEERLLRAYLATICFSNIERLEVFSKIAIFEGGGNRRLSDFINLEFCDSISFEDWWTHVSNWVGDHRFVLFAFKIDGDSHIRTVVEFDPVSSALETYDPNPSLPANAILMTREELSGWWSSGRLNHDLLSIWRRDDHEWKSA